MRGGAVAGVVLLVALGGAVAAFALLGKKVSARLSGSGELSTSIGTKVVTEVTVTNGTDDQLSISKIEVFWFFKGPPRDILGETIIGKNLVQSLGPHSSIIIPLSEFYIPPIIQGVSRFEAEVTIVQLEKPVMTNSISIDTPIT